MTKESQIHGWQALQRAHDDQNETQLSWEDSHPWLSSLTKHDEDDSFDDVIRYTLDELRLA